MGSKGHFFLIDTDDSRQSRVNEVQSDERKREPYQTVRTVYFILGILRTDLWNQGTARAEREKKRKKPFPTPIPLAFVVNKSPAVFIIIRALTDT